MQVVNAKEAKSSFGLLMTQAQREPVMIQKNGHPMAVMLSIEAYEHLESIEAQWWADQAQKAGESEGFLGHDASKILLEKLRHAQD